MSVLVGIDGTGEAILPGADRDTAYDAAFANSFVRRICRGNPNARYFRGPVALGGGLPEAIAGGIAFIRQKKRQSPSESVLLTGYSRGAAGAIVIAKRLKDVGINVRAMMLFDCVDRHLAFDADEIPNNVGYVCHVIRNPAARSRMTFDNDGLRYRPPTVFPVATMFMGTHGAMGGTPWAMPRGASPNDFIDEGGLEAALSPVRRGPVWNYTTRVTYAQDQAASNQVWNFVQPFLRRHGF